MEIMKVLLPPKDYMVNQVLTIEPYINAKKIDEAMDILDYIAGKLPPPVNDIVPFGYLFIYAETGDTAKAREAIKNAENLIEGFGEEVLRANVYYGQGQINELLGNYRDAIEDYYRILEMNVTNYFLHTMIARCYRNLDDYEKADEEIKLSLKYRPFNAENNYEAALLYFDMGEEGKGLEFLNRAVDIWQDADPDYDKANKAKDLLATYN
jgi:tetratricopeptide (TPR) repeat protein